MYLTDQQHVVEINRMVFMVIQAEVVWAVVEYQKIFLAIFLTVFHARMNRFNFIRSILIARLIILMLNFMFSYFIVLS